MTPPETTTQPPAIRRISPRPLGLHLMSAAMSLTGAAAALPLARRGLIRWHPALAAEAEALTAEIAESDETDLTLAVMEQVQERLSATLRGIELYQGHGYARRVTEPPAAWEQGPARLLDFGGGGRPVLFAPSLVNRAHVLDLDEGASLMRWLAGRGRVRPMLMDWGAPAGPVRGYGTADYVTGPLADALAHVAEMAGGPAPLVGYCMGGTLSAAAAQLYPDRVSALGLLAAPWDFHASLSPQAKVYAGSVGFWRPVLEAFGEMPVDLLQSFFAALDPNLAQRKFEAFSRLDMDSPEARRFVALEDWLNDGVPLTARVAEETLNGWFGQNRAATGHWLIDGVVIDPARIAAPAFVAIPEKDRIVPPASAAALAALLPGATTLRLPAGHIGMVVGRHAETTLWRPLERWLAAVE
ncbi:poly-beta-hydroxybutyrate polymerase [Minwuia thermotolerans]|uniref:Poly-beta-hydroxybutyrate polymerase n=2 Tax=Minwuia thermotolerans TaxID=2056226 RepID=A0A2M9G327_9PROT|nr:poly-beta-hydroxybutyrate polymerase [Minwuia thermotolerans]